MKKIIDVLKKFFFPPADSSRWTRVLPFIVLGVLTGVVLIAGNKGWEYTNSSEFCGTACHTMPPEYAAYLSSPHARVNCVECHIGRTGFAAQFTRKAADLRHVFFNVTGAFEYPIRARHTRPAREICETCHSPEKFSDDSLREIQRYAPDEENTWTTINLLMSTGGGTARDGLGYGIHWHVENPVLYLATDDLQQGIPYVRVMNEDGTMTEYLDVSSDVDISAIDEEELHEMDCITCHNRITHYVPKPEDAVNLAITKGLISPDLPYVVWLSVTLLDQDYESKEAGIAAMEGVTAYYEENYPEIAVEHAADIAQVVTALQDIYNQNIFPDQEMDWDTHPDNLGHINDPGCFRCHDGGHLTEEKEAIRLECNICHSIPVVSDETDLVTTIELSGGVEPPSHTNTNWMTLHGRVIDQTCESCHTPTNPDITLVDLTNKPPADDSFCGNEACHSNVWTYAAFSEDALQPFLEEQIAAMAPPPAPEVDEDAPVALTYVDLVQPKFDAVCTACHTGDASGGLDLNSYEALLAGGETGPAVVPGDPDASVLVQVQSTDDHFRNLSEADLDSIIEWILAGAPEN